MPSNRVKLISLVLFCCLLLVVVPVNAQESYTVQPGETLYRIALNYGVTVEELAQANGIVNSWHIEAGQTLVIPGEAAPVEIPVDAPAEFADESAPVTPAETPTYHTVARGEGLGTIAEQYSMSMQALADLNGITNADLIYAGQQLIVGTAPVTSEVPITEAIENPVAVEPESTIPAEAITTHVILPGEHLMQIATQYGVSWPALAQANGITNPDQVFAGQQLIIPASTNVDDFGIVNPALANVVPPAPPTIFEGKQIVVDLSDSRIYAYENGQLLRNVLASTGLPYTPTVQGDYEVYVKYEAQTMSGPGYYLPDVPWVMYFYSGYGIHGTYWHNNFGQPMSHGCVNLPTPEAEWFYNWAEVGTPVHVRA